jgi:protocatechuate 3,4-dioxygenase beta subunit
MRSCGLTAISGCAGASARHIHFIINHSGHAEPITRLYFKNDASLGDRTNDRMALVPEAMHSGGTTRWVSGYKFVLRPVGE